MDANQTPIMRMSPEERRLKDPWLEEEVAKYGSDPIPSRLWLRELLAQHKAGLPIGRIMSLFALDVSRRGHLRDRLRRMVREGQLYKEGAKFTVYGPDGEMAPAEGAAPEARDADGKGLRRRRRNRGSSLSREGDLAPYADEEEAPPRAKTARAGRLDKLERQLSGRRALLSELDALLSSEIDRTALVESLMDAGSAGMPIHDLKDDFVSQRHSPSAFDDAFEALIDCGDVEATTHWCALREEYFSLSADALFLSFKAEGLGAVGVEAMGAPKPARKRAPAASTVASKVLAEIKAAGPISMRALLARIGAEAELRLGETGLALSPLGYEAVNLERALERLVEEGKLVAERDKSFGNPLSKVYLPVKSARSRYLMVRRIDNLKPDSYTVECSPFPKAESNDRERFTVERRDGVAPFYRDLIQVTEYDVGEDEPLTKITGITQRGNERLTGYLLPDAPNLFRFVCINSKMQDMPFYLSKDYDPAQLKRAAAPRRAAGPGAGAGAGASDEFAGADPALAEDGPVVLKRNAYLLAKVGDMSACPDFTKIMVEPIEFLGQGSIVNIDEVTLAVSMFDLPREFSQETREEVATFPSAVKLKDFPERTNLTRLPLITIDGETSRDFDDAVYAKKLKDGSFELIVAIADVSHYVRPGTALDADAKLRGTSVYFPRQVIPMLPEELSNDLCSLNPNVNRLCFACKAHVTAQGEVDGFEFFEAVMKSRNRMTYGSVHKLLGEFVDPELKKRHPYELTAKDKATIVPDHERLPQLRDLYELYKALKRSRAARMALDFETTETQMTFNAAGLLEKIIPAERNEAHMLIEECMLVANVAAASMLQQANAGGLFRIHAAPQGDRVSLLLSKLAFLGLKAKNVASPDHKFYSDLIAQVADRGAPERELIHLQMLRSLPRAEYSPNNLGHFGLSYDCYTHFTSPIRRYPDLLVHRCLKAILSGRRYVPSESWEILGVQTSYQERRADDASFYVEKLIKAQFMKDKVGEAHMGRITSFVGSFVAVTLDEYYIEGMVHIKEFGIALNDYFVIDESQMFIQGERSGMRFGIGEPMGIVVESVRDTFVDFALDQDWMEARLSRKKAERRKRGRLAEPKDARPDGAGVSGVSGASGVSSASRVLGPAGWDGADGKDGKAGKPGKAGRPGKTDPGERRPGRKKSRRS